MARESDWAGGWLGSRVTLLLAPEQASFAWFICPTVPLTNRHHPTHARRYKKADNAFYIFADDVAPRHMTAALT